MKIGIARYPYYRQRLKGGDYVLFDAVAAALQQEHEVDFIEYRRPFSWLLRRMPPRPEKFCAWLIDLCLPFLFTRQILRKLDQFDLVLADSAVITDVGARPGEHRKVIAVINIDYGAYLAAVGRYLTPRARYVLNWKSWMQERGLASVRSVAVSRFVAETMAARGVVTRIIENQIEPLPPSFGPASRQTGLVYAGSGDYWGKGLDVLKALAENGYPVHIYSPVSLEGCTCHGPVRREALIGNLPAYQVMVFPSRYESFGLIVIESLAAGLPVVMRRTGIGVDLETVLPECVVPDDATTGDWAKAVEAVLADRARIARQGALFASAYMDTARFAQRWRDEVIAINDNGN